MKRFYTILKTELKLSIRGMDMIDVYKRQTRREMC